MATRASPASATVVQLNCQEPEAIESCSKERSWHSPLHLFPRSSEFVTLQCIMANIKRICYPRLPMDEGRKRVLLIAASILAARRLAQWDGRPSPVVESAIADAITLAEKILSKIDARWPANPIR